MYKTTLIYFLIRALNGMLALASIFILTRILSPEQYGVYALGLAGIGLCSAVMFQWIAVAVSRFYAAYKTDPDTLLTEANRLFVRVAGTVFVLTGMYAAWSPVPNVTPQLAWAIGLGGTAMGLHSMSLQVANARVEPLSYGALTVSRGALGLAAAVAFVAAGFGGMGALFGSALASALSVILYNVRRLPKTNRGNPPLRNQMLAYGLPLTLTYLATMALDISDRFIIGAILGTAAVASYAIAYDLAQQVVGAAINVLFLASYPKVLVAWETGSAPAARNAMLPLFRTILLGAPLVTGIFIGLTEEISRFFFGADVRADAAQVMPWVAIAIAIGCIKSYFLDIAFQIEKITRMQFRITVTMAVINAVLNFALIQNMKVVGAAIATAVAFSVGAFLSWWYGRRVNIYPGKVLDIAKMLIVLFSIILTMHLMPRFDNRETWNAILGVLGGGFSYLMAVFATDLGSARTFFCKKIQSNGSKFS